MLCLASHALFGLTEARGPVGDERDAPVNDLGQAVAHERLGDVAVRVEDRADKRLVVLALEDHLDILLQKAALREKLGLTE